MTAGMILGKCVKDLDESHCVPSLSASPAVLRESGLFVRPEHIAVFVPSVAVQTCLGVESAFVGFLHLGACVVVDSFSLFFGKNHSCGESRVGQTHEDAVEPHLVGVDGFMPVNTLFCARLILHLLHEGLHRLEVFLFGEVLVHA